MVLTSQYADGRKLVFLDPDVVKWRIRLRVDDVARIYLRYEDRIEERVLVAVDDDTMTPGGLVAVNSWSVPPQRQANFWRVD